MKRSKIEIGHTYAVKLRGAGGILHARIDRKVNWCGDGWLATNVESGLYVYVKNASSVLWEVVAKHARIY